MAGTKNIKTTDLTANGGVVTFLSRLSFQPLISTWQQKIEEGKEGTRSFYRELLEKVSQYPELLQPVLDLAVLKKHQALLNIMMSTVFPVTFSDKNDLYAVAIPFTYQVIYSSQLFQNFLTHKNSNLINIGDETSKEIIKDKLSGAYQLILNKFYGTNLPASSISIHPYKHPVTGLEKFMELELDARFVDVKAKDALPKLPASFSINNTADILKTDDLQQWLPLSMFEFEGMMLVKVKDVTEQQIIHEIKNNLITVNAFTEVENFEKLQAQIQNLIGKYGLKIGITPFFKINGHFVFSDMYEPISLLFQHDTTFGEKQNFYQQLDRFFSQGNNLLLVSKLTKIAVREYPFLQHLYANGGMSVIICPLINEKELIGTLEIVSETPGQLRHELFAKISLAIPLFTLSLEKSAKNLQARVDAVIKERFTAVQTVVEWRFTDAALNYISNSQKNEEAKIENIVFENVYPLYGAIDIRNSSVERNQAIQQDLLEQLRAVNSIIKIASKEINYPLLNNIKNKSETYIQTIAGNMHSDDEFEIHGFLKKEIKELFQHLRRRIPAMQPEIDEYFSIIDSDTKTWSLHRKEFEESITYVNDIIVRFIDREQLKAQQLFPHYFERFVTDGIDFNIYIGQSISPQRTFTPDDLQRLKLWQLTTLARAAMLGKSLEQKSPVSLQTTQLILAHSEPISISFRAAERKFDVDGAYNIRYEIIKKRIDKVHIRDTNERLTQPGMLAVVYTQPEEAGEYIKFFETLQQDGLLKSDVQEFELEELQGVSGLKALRIGINLQEEVENNSPQEKISAKR
jgi:hypothetical protein